MEPYADFDFYTKTYLSGREAVLDAASFPFFARRATQEIARYIGENLSGGTPDCIKYCCCEVAELLYTARQEEAMHSISSESVGDWSRQYESGEAATRAFRKKICSAVYAWLTGSGLLYAGR